MTIYIAADHRGFPLKQQLVSWLEQTGYTVEDCGNTVDDPADDYPDFVARLGARMDPSDSTSRGVVICGSGVGVSIAANKYKGLRAGLLQNATEVATAVEHDFINVLAIGSDHTDIAAAQQMIEIFLNTPYSSEERHKRRVGKVDALG